MRLFQAALDTPLASPFSPPPSQFNGLHFTVCAPSTIGWHRSASVKFSLGWVGGFDSVGSVRSDPKCTTASPPQSLAIFRITDKIAKGFLQWEAKLTIFHRKTAIVSLLKKSPPRIWTSLWAPLAVIQCRWPYNETLKQIAAYNFDCVSESQASTANHRRETGVDSMGLFWSNFSLGWGRGLVP